MHALNKLNCSDVWSSVSSRYTDVFRTHIVTEVCKKREDFIEVNNRGKVECDLCDKTYVDVKSLRRHLQSNHGSGKKKLTCENCNKAFAYRSPLVRHMKKEHYD